MRSSHSNRTEPRVNHAARSAAQEALRQVEDGKPAFAALQEAARLTSRLPEGGTHGTPAWAYSELLEALAMAVRWTPAVRAAEADADRYRKAAITRAIDVSTAEQLYPWPQGLRSAADILETL